MRRILYRACLGVEVAVCIKGGVGRNVFSQP